MAKEEVEEIPSDAPPAVYMQDLLQELSDVIFTHVQLLTAFRDEQNETHKIASEEQLKAWKRISRETITRAYQATDLANKEFAKEIELMKASIAQTPAQPRRRSEEA